LWSPGGETNFSITVSPSTSADYSVVYTVNGCSSISSTGNVTVEVAPDISVLELNNVITAQQTSALYQWLDCDNGNSIINGETSQSYSPFNNGNYAVEIDLNGCIDTSTCAQIISISIDEIVTNEEFMLFPNPVNDILYITSKSSLTGVNYLIVDINGKVILKGIIGYKPIIQVEQLSKGIYLLQFEGFNYKALFFAKQ